eukprot:TRINITY_DN3397_c0_g1_i1.p1 TRINITY_DN3397_c0_g1~~TRINITY_DN3397_c0_g1_i1.p1  ORF type:complete len:576 (+),score=89.02 TRINITY_DN3397_c0_g1_i1:127-1854(+)
MSGAEPLIVELKKQPKPTKPLQGSITVRTGPSTFCDYEIGPLIREKKDGSIHLYHARKHGDYAFNFVAKAYYPRKWFPVINPELLDAARFGAHVGMAAALAGPESQVMPCFGYTDSLTKFYFLSIWALYTPLKEYMALNMFQLDSKESIRESKAVLYELIKASLWLKNLPAPIHHRWMPGERMAALFTPIPSLQLITTDFSNDNTYIDQRTMQIKIGDLDACVGVEAGGSCFQYVEYRKGIAEAELAESKVFPSSETPGIIATWLRLYSPKPVEKHEDVDQFLSATNKVWSDTEASQLETIFDNTVYGSMTDRWTVSTLKESKFFDEVRSESSTIVSEMLIRKSRAPQGLMPHPAEWRHDYPLGMPPRGYTQVGESKRRKLFDEANRGGTEERVNKEFSPSLLEKVPFSSLLDELQRLWDSTCSNFATPKDVSCDRIELAPLLTPEGKIDPWKYEHLMARALVMHTWVFSYFEFDFQRYSVNTQKVAEVNLFFKGKNRSNSISVSTLESFLKGSPSLAKSTSPLSNSPAFFAAMLVALHGKVPSTSVSDDLGSWGIPQNPCVKLFYKLAMFIGLL